MTTTTHIPTFPKAALYAVAVCLLPWSVGASLVFLLYFGRGIGSYASEPAFVVFPTLASLVVLTLRLLWPMATRLRTASVDTVAYTVTLWMVSVVGFSAGGSVGEAVDGGFVMLIAAFFTLQYPVFFALSLVLSKRLLGLDQPILNEPTRSGG